MSVLYIVGGIALLYLGGERLVASAARLARGLGISPMAIGLTVVAFGTSSPELLTTLAAAFRGNPGIAVGNVVGSNISNIGLILGLTVVMAPIRTNALFIKRELPFMIGVAILPAPFLLDGMLGRIEGLVLLGLLAAYVWFLLRGGEAPDIEEEFAREYGAAAGPAWRNWLGVALGLAVLVFGAHLLVTGATGVARSLGIPDLVIGLTVVAIGTSLPELATSIVAAVKGEPDIALGNIVGSNIFNVLCILGTTALIRPLAMPFDAVAVDLIVMIGFSALALPFLLTGLRLGRLEGAALLGLYAAYAASLFVRP